MVRNCQEWYNPDMARPKDKPKEDKPKDKPKSPHTKTLTIKQRKFTKALARSGNATQAIIDAGYNTKTRAGAGNLAVDNLKKPSVVTALNEELDKVGLTSTKTAEILEEAITSGVGRDSRNSDALRGLDMLFKVRGNYAPKRVDKREISLSFQGKEDSELMQMMQEQMEMLTKAIESK